MPKSKRFEPATTTTIQFGEFVSQWYFFYGQCMTFNYTFCIFSLPLCNPKVAASLNLDLASTHLYLVSGGIGEGGHWYAIPGGAFMQGIYQNTSDDGTTFNWTGMPTPDLPIQKVQFVSPQPGLFRFTCQWTNLADGNPVPPFPGWTGTYTVDTTLQASPQTAHLNGENGCAPTCAANVGSRYWSYTRMQVTAAVTGANINPLQGQGLGWLDNQWIQSGKMRLLPAAIRNVLTIGKVAPPIRWLWLNIQDETRKCQFMLYVPMKKDDLVAVGGTYRPSFVNMYTDSGTSRIPTRNVQVTVTHMVTMHNYAFPVQYRVHMDNLPPSVGTSSVDYILSSIQNAPLITAVLGVKAWEGSGVLTDLQGNSPGFCFIEANFMAPTCTLVKDYTSQARLSGSDAAAFGPTAPSLVATLLSSGLVTTLLTVIIGCIVLLVVFMRHLLLHPKHATQQRQK
jgi:hypothetical protein